MFPTAEDKVDILCLGKRIAATLEGRLDGSEDIRAHEDVGDASRRVENGFECPGSRNTLQ